MGHPAPRREARHGEMFHEETSGEAHHRSDAEIETTGIRIVIPIGVVIGQSPGSGDLRTILEIPRTPGSQDVTEAAAVTVVLEDQEVDQSDQSDGGEVGP